MVNKEPSKTGFLVTIGLLIITWVVTIWLFHYLTDPQTRSETFGFTLAFICFLEFLCFGYFAVLFIPNFRKGVVWALYPVFGVIVGLYVALSLLIVIGYNLFSLFISSPKAYFTVLTVESLIFFIVLGLIVILNKYKKVEDIRIEEEKRGLANLFVEVQGLHQNFLNCKESLDIQTYREIEIDLRKLKERFQFCTPFGRSNSKEVVEIEKEIQSRIASLGNLVVKIPSAKKEELEKMIKALKHLIAIILQAMERREKLLIK